ncbi:MAG: MFS transporter [Thermoplasmata archaeon]|nr:MFS transporter [Thermoplasmata archaeon]
MTDDAPPVGPTSPAVAGSSTAAGGIGLSRRSAALVVTGIVLGLLMGSLDQFVVLTALPKIVSDLGQSNGVTFVVSAYLVATTIAVPIFAKLSDTLSRRNVFLVGLAIFIAGSTLAGLSQNLGELIVFRGLQGFGSGCFFPVGIGIIAYVFDPATRARLTGALSGVFGIATVGGPFLGSFIVDHVTWRWVFYVNIPIGLLGMAILAVSLGPLRPAHRSTFDVRGAAMLAVWVGALTYALYQVSNTGWAWSDSRTLALLGLSAGVFVVFVLFELRQANPVVPLRLFRDRTIALGGSIAFLSRSVVFSLLTFLAIYVGVVLLQDGPGSADTVRDVLWFLVIPMILGSVFGGQLVTRVPYRPLVGAGMALIVLGMFGLTSVTSTTPVWKFAFGFLPTGGIVLPLIPIGVGLGLSLGPSTLMVQYRVPPKDVGAATGLVQFLGTLGASIGLSVFASYQNWRYQLTAPAAPPAACAVVPPPGSCVPILGSYHTSVLSELSASYANLFTVMLALAVVALVLSLFLQGRMPKNVLSDPAPPVVPAE